MFSLTKFRNFTRICLWGMGPDSLQRSVDLPKVSDGYVLASEHFMPHMVFWPVAGPWQGDWVGRSQQCLLVLMGLVLSFRGHGLSVLFENQGSYSNSIYFPDPLFSDPLLDPGRPMVERMATTLKVVTIQGSLGSLYFYNHIVYI